MTNDEAMKAALQNEYPRDINFRRECNDMNWTCGALKSWSEGFEAGWKASRLHTLTEDPLLEILTDALCGAVRVFIYSVPSPSLNEHQVSMVIENMKNVSDAWVKYRDAVASIKDGGK